MTKLTIISSQNLGKILRSIGFEMIRQKGSHQIFRHPDGRQTIVPFHKGEDIGRGLLKTILSEIDISVQDYEKLRKNK